MSLTRSRLFACGAPLIVLLIALLVRCIWSDTAYFTRDQARDVAAGRAILGGELATTGPVVGQSPYRLGPLHYYVVAAGLRIGGDWRGAVALLAALNALGVALWCTWMRRAAGDRHAGAAWLGGIALATHGLAIAHARELWNPALIAPTTALFAIGLWRWAVDRRAWGLGLAAVGAALMVQAHAMTAVLLPLGVVALWRRGPIRSRGAWLGVAIAVALTAPWVMHDLGVWWERGGDALGFYRDAGEPPAPYWVAVFRALTFERYLTGRNALGPTSWRVAVDVANCVFVGFVALGIARLFVTRRALACVVAGPIVLAALIAALPRHSTYYYYLEPTAPLRCFAFAVGVTALSRRDDGVRRALRVAVALVALAVPFAHWVRGAVETHRTDLISGIGDVDLRAPWPSSPERVANRFPTARAKVAMGSALGRHGIDLAGLTRLGRGGWWPAFVDDGGALLGSVEARSEDPALIVHPSAASLQPADRQIVARESTGSFELIRFRSAIDHDSVKLRSGGSVANDVAWSIVTSAAWRSPTAELEFRFHGDAAAVDRVRFVVTTAFGARVESLELGGRPARECGRWRRQGFETIAFEIDARRAVEALALRLDGRAAAGRPVWVNVYDVWR